MPYLEDQRGARIDSASDIAVPEGKQAAFSHCGGAESKLIIKKADGRSVLEAFNRP
jgi:hypothetical protein